MTKAKNIFIKLAISTDKLYSTLNIANKRLSVLQKLSKNAKQTGDYGRLSDLSIEGLNILKTKGKVLNKLYDKRIKS